MAALANGTAAHALDYDNTAKNLGGHVSAVMVPALLAAASGEEDDAAGVQLLLKHKARVDARDARGRSALHEAALAGHVEIIAVLLAAHADVQARDEHGRTPLLDAARGARLPALEALVAGGAEIGALDGDGLGALALACTADTSVPALVRRLLELGADPDRIDREGKRAIEHAAQAGRWALVAALDPDYPLPAAVVEDAPAAPPTDRAPLALLRESLRAGRFEGLDNLVRLLPRAEFDGLLLDDDLPPSPQRIEWLLARGADPETRTGAADNVMFALLARGAPALPALQVLLRRAVSPAGAGGLARFLGACAAGDQAARGLEQCALELLERGADPFAPSAAGDPPLALAIRLGWLRLVERLIVADDAAVDAGNADGAQRRRPFGEDGRRPSVARVDGRVARAADDEIPLQRSALDRRRALERRREAIVPAEELARSRRRQDLHVRRRHHQPLCIERVELLAGVERADFYRPRAPRHDRGGEDSGQIMAEGADLRRRLDRPRCVPGGGRAVQRGRVAARACRGQQDSESARDDPHRHAHDAI